MRMEQCVIKKREQEINHTHPSVPEQYYILGKYCIIKNNYSTEFDKKANDTI